MLGTVISFIGGSAFRMIWGELSSMWTKHQEHKQELARMELQIKLDDRAHERQLEMIKLQHTQGVEIVRVQGEVDLGKLDAEIFKAGVEVAGRSTGIKWVDAWNSAIRAALATECMVLISLHYHQAGWVMDDRGWELSGAVLGVFVADRLLFRRGK